MKVCITVALLIFVLTQSGCLAPASLESGRTIGKDKREMGIGISYGKFKTQNTEKEEYENLPWADVFWVYGISDKADASLKINISSFVTARLKYQFLGDKRSFIAASAGAEAGTAPILFLIGSPPSYASIPLYISLHPTKNIAIYGTPRYVVNLSKNKTFNNYFGLSYGIMYGEKYKFILEAAHNYLDKLSNPTQVSVGFSANVEGFNILNF